MHTNKEDKKPSRRAASVRDASDLECSVCGEKFDQVTDIERHATQDHPGLRPFKCSFESCTSDFASYYLRLKHVKQVHIKKKTHMCPFCGVLFVRGSALNVHVKKVHSNSDEGSVRCPLCHKKIADMLKLKEHMSVHTGERNFTCDFKGCGKSFRLI